jgi:hypothetical protein
MLFLFWTSQNSSFVPGSLPTDLSPEEIQRKLQELLQENLELKGNFGISVLWIMNVYEPEDRILKVLILWTVQH